MHLLENGVRAVVNHLVDSKLELLLGNVEDWSVIREKPGRSVSSPVWICCSVEDGTRNPLNWDHGNASQEELQGQRKDVCFCSRTKKIRMVSGRFEEDLLAADAYQKTRDVSQQSEFPELPEVGS